MSSLKDKTKVFFWQNMKSIHQASFFEELSSKGSFEEITLIITEPLSNNRIKMGWCEPCLENVNTIELTEQADGIKIIEDNKGKDCIHIFSGIGAFKNVNRAFLYAKNKGCRIGIMSESLDPRGWKGFLRIVRGYYHFFKYNKYIEFILAIGLQARQQFERWGYNKSYIFDWSYGIKYFNHNNDNYIKNKKFKIIYAGSLYHLKGYDILLDALYLINKQSFEADFYSLSSPKEKSKIQIKKEYQDVINVLNFLPNDKLRLKMSEYDLLVLPSRYDGWGAVINESLMEGVPVLVSSHCGSSILVRNNPELGTVIEPLNVETIKRNLENIISNNNINEAKHPYIKKWAYDNISGKALVDYFEEILCYLNKENNKYPVAPWCRKKG